MSRSLLAALVLAAAAASSPAFAQDPPSPKASPSPSLIEQANAAAFEVHSQLGALVTTTGSTDAGNGASGLGPTVEVYAEGPLAFGTGQSLGRVGARLVLTTAPGQSADSADATNYRAVEVGLRYARVVGLLNSVRTALVLEGSFTNRLKGANDPKPLNRLVRSLAAGISFDAPESNANVSLLAGYDEATASCTAPVICTGFRSGLTFLLYGQVPILDGRVLFGGDVSIASGAQVPWVQRRDVERVFVVVDPAKVLQKGKAAP
jgi:hypothetical protein